MKDYSKIIPKSPFEDEHLPLSEQSFLRAMKIKKHNEACVFPDKTISFLCNIIEWQRQYIKNDTQQEREGK